MFHKVESVLALENYVLLVTFSCGKRKLYDVKPVMKKYPRYDKALKRTPTYFSKVKVSVSGYGVLWDEDTDISWSELWNSGIDIL